MTEPIVKLEAVGPDGKTWSVYACPKCRTAHQNSEIAKACCVPAICKCGKAVDGRWFTVCGECRRAEDEEKEERRLHDAKTIPASEYSGPVYCDDTSEYYESVGDFLDALDEEDPVPKHVWACITEHLVLNAEDIISDALERQDHHEDACDQITDIPALQHLLDEWIKENSRVESWFCNYDLLVDLSEFSKE